MLLLSIFNVRKRWKNLYYVIWQCVRECEYANACVDRFFPVARKSMRTKSKIHSELSEHNAVPKEIGNELVENRNAMCFLMCVVT